MAKSRSKKAKVEEAGGDDDAAEVKDVKKKTKVKTSKGKSDERARRCECSRGPIF